MLLNFFPKKSSDPQIPLINYNNDSKTKRLFYAIAQGLIYLIKTSQLNDVNQLKPLLNEHANYYPRQLPKHIQNLDINEQLEYLLIYNHPHLEKLVPALAYTMQQLVVDTICKYPEVYGNLLLEGKTVEQLRKTENLDHSSVLQALAAHVLDINIFVERYPEAYLLPVKEYYLTKSINHSQLYIHYQDHFYTTQSEVEGEK